MIKTFRFRNFRSYRDSVLGLSKVTFLIGANGAGKSNAVDAFRFLNWMGRGERLDDLEVRLGAETGQIRGTSEDLFFHGTAEFEFDITVSADKDYRFKQAIAHCSRDDAGVKTPFMAVHAESLLSPTELLPLYSLPARQIPEHSESVEVEYNNFSRGPNKPRVTCTNRQAIFYQLMSESRFDNPDSKVALPQGARMLKETFGQMLFLDPNLAKMRDYTRKIRGRSLNQDASNVSSVIYDICQNNDAKADLLEIIKSLPEQDIREISFVETEIGDVMLQLEECFGDGNTTPATLLSDGTLRLLAISAGILSVPRNSMVVIEEIDNGIHPSRISHIVSQLYRIAEKRDIQILVTTHNPAVMSAIPLREIGNVLCCYRNSDDGVSEILKLSRAPRFAELVAKGKLGDLAISDELGAIVRDHMSKEDIVAERLKQFDLFDSMFSDEDETWKD